MSNVPPQYHLVPSTFQYQYHPKYVPPKKNLVSVNEGWVMSNEDRKKTREDNKTLISSNKLILSSIETELVLTQFE